MNKEESLLMPRVKCIGTGEEHYPKSPYKIGQIITCADRDFGDINYFRKWPHLFQPLPWYAERKIEDLPAFVKIEDEVRKVIDFFPKNEISEVSCTLEKSFGGYDRECFNLDYCLPASAEDYTNYQNSLKK